jgi:membrane protease YdiL (CAAX protease family)
MPEWGTPKDTVLDMAWYGLATVALTIIYTWVFNKTKGSLVIVILMHASNDAFFIDQLFLAPIVTHSLLPFVIGFGATALLLVFLTRGRLGYVPSEQEVADIGGKTLGGKGLPA